MSKNQKHGLVPKKQDGSGYSFLLAQPNGEAMYGAFHALILRLFHHDPDVRDGWLTDDGTKDGVRYTPKTLAPLLQFSDKTIKSMLSLVIKDIGWIANHSTPEKHTEGYPGRIVSKELIAISKKFHDAQMKRHPNEPCFSRYTRDKVDYEGAKKLNTLIDKYGVSIDEIKATLDWVVKNKFWRMVMHSLGGILKPAKNDSIKFLNAMKGMQAATTISEFTEDQMLRMIGNDSTLSTKDFEKIDINGEIKWQKKDGG